jgi:ubiquinone/menaquinone biosynthesis C-methylase UbiE
VSWTIALLDIKPDDRILDVGCGPGALIHAIAEQTTEAVVAGVDTSPVMLKQATRRNAGFIQQRRVQLHQGSALALPFAAAAFDSEMSIT